MKRTTTVAVVLFLVGCGGSGPSQAEAPKPSLDDKPPHAGAADTGGASAEAMAALEAAEAKSWADAKAKADAVLAKNPKDAVAHYARGIVAEDADKDLDAAEKHYVAALEADPKLVGASIFLSALYIKREKWDDAAKVARAGLEHAKGTYELHLHLALALHGKGDHALAAKAYANAVTLRPDDGKLRFDHGEELLEAGDKDGAAKAFKGAIAKAKGDSSLIALSGLELKKAGDLPGCVAAMDQAIAVKASGAFYTERAICKHAAKDVEGARKDLDEAIKLEPSSKNHFYAAKFAEDAGDKKACKTHYEQAAKLAAAAKPGTKVEEEAKKGAARCK